MPLAREVLVPTLLAGARTGDPEALRWLVHVTLNDDARTDLIAPELHARSHEAGLLAAALARNPEAPDLWRIAFAFEIDVADWGTHHLGEGILILPEEDCLRSVAKARAVLDGAPAGALGDGPREELDELTQVLHDYRAWSDEASDEDFPDWCARHGRDHGFAVAYYYGS
jgi:hypothetical protein